MNHEYRSVEKWASVRGLDSSFPDTVVVEQEGYQFSIWKNSKKGVAISAILGNRGLNKETVKGLKKALTPYGKMRYNKKPSYIEFLYRPKNADEGGGIDQALELLIHHFQQHHIQTTEDCVLCGLGGSDSGIQRIEGRVYPAHKTCIQRDKQEKEGKGKKRKNQSSKTKKSSAPALAPPSLPAASSKVQETPSPRNEAEGSLLTGLLGGLLGGALFSLPFLFAYGIFSKFWVWLLVLVPLGVAVGYRLLKGKRSTGGQVMALVLSLVFLVVTTLAATYQAPYRYSFQSFKQAKKVIDGTAALEAVGVKNPYIADYVSTYSVFFTNEGTPGGPKYSEYKSFFTPSEFWENGFIKEVFSLSGVSHRIEDVGLGALFALLSLSLALPLVGKRKKTREELWEENMEGYVPAHSQADTGLTPQRDPVSPREGPAAGSSSPSAQPHWEGASPPALQPANADLLGNAQELELTAPASLQEPLLVRDRTPVSGEHLFENQPAPNFDQKTPPEKKTYEELFADILGD